MKSEVIVRETKNKYIEKAPNGACFLYDNLFGRVILFFASKRFVSSLAGKYMNTKLSTRHISSFIKKNKINMAEYEDSEYKSFNDFFSRKIISSKRPLSKDNKDFLAPADSKVLVYNITDDEEFIIKNKKYTIKDILRNDSLAAEYKNGYFLVFRLSVDDYHRYHFIDNGEVIKEYKINGLFHTVGPIAFKRHRVFQENQREYSILKTENFKEIVQMEVGALMVGKIVNHKVKKFKRGEEKGYFLFGGSTVVIMVKKNIIKIDKDILENSSLGIETKVKLFEVIGRKVG